MTTAVAMRDAVAFDLEGGLIVAAAPTRSHERKGHPRHEGDRRLEQLVIMSR